MFKLSTWWQSKRIQAKVRLPGRRVQVQRVVNPYHAVSIEAGPGCCTTAQNFAGRRFLTWEAPSVPQPSCDVATCHCRYISTGGTATVVIEVPNWRRSGIVVPVADGE